MEMWNALENVERNQDPAHFAGSAHAVETDGLDAEEKLVAMVFTVVSTNFQVGYSANQSHFRVDRSSDSKGHQGIWAMVMSSKS